MTGFVLTDEQAALQDAARAFLQRAWSPAHVRRVRTPGGEGHDRELWRAMADLGWLGLAFDESLGGGGGSLLDLAVVYEEAGRALVPTTLASTVEAALLIDRAGDDRQRADLLPAVLGGERLVSVALHEAGMRWSPGALSTRVHRDGDDVVVDGTKLFVPNAGVADDLVVVGRDPGADGAAATSVRLVVVPAGAAGVSRQRLETFAGDGQHRVVFERVRVGADRVLAAPEGAWPTVERARRASTALQCMEMVGGARAVLDLTVGHVTNRVQFGRPLGSFQAVQHQIADVWTRVDAAALAAWQAVGRCAEDCPPARGAEAGVAARAAPAAAAAVAIAKVAAGDAYVEATLVAHELHGGVGFAIDHDLHLWSDRARTAAVTLGSRDDHLRALGSLIAARDANDM